MVRAMDRAMLTNWVAAYERAWRTEGTDALGALFAEDATYRTAPFEEPCRGLSAISAMWEEARDGPDEAFDLESELIAVEGDTGVVRLKVRYGELAPQTYRDIWIVRLDEEGRCTAFEEWPFWPRGTHGAFLEGPRPR
jgi:ketosteroid isomerase-like protein